MQGHSKKKGKRKDTGKIKLQAQDKFRSFQGELGTHTRLFQIDEAITNNALFVSLENFI